MTSGKVMEKAFKRRGFKLKGGSWVRVLRDILIRFTPHEWTSKSGGRFYYAYTLEKMSASQSPCVNDSDQCSTVKHIDSWIQFSQVR